MECIKPCITTLNRKLLHPDAEHRGIFLIKNASRYENGRHCKDFTLENMTIPGSNIQSIAMNPENTRINNRNSLVASTVL